MKYLLLLPILFLTACSGSEESASVDLRQACEPTSFLTSYLWVDEDLNELAFYPSCYAQSQVCGTNFYYNKPVNNQILITIDTADGEPGCLKADTEYICSIELYDTPDLKGVSYNCGGGLQIYVNN